MQAKISSGMGCGGESEFLLRKCALVYENLDYKGSKCGLYEISYDVDVEVGGNMRGESDCLVSICAIGGHLRGSGAGHEGSVGSDRPCNGLPGTSQPRIFFSNVEFFCSYEGQMLF